MSTALFEPDYPRQELLFVGWLGRDCGEHRTVGDYRAWCFSCSEWCYSSEIDMGCAGCRLPGLERTRKEYWALRKALDLLIVDADDRGKRKVKVIDIEAAIRADSDSESEPTGNAVGGVVGISMTRVPAWTEVEKVIAHHNRAYPRNPGLLIAVSSADVLRRFWSLGWVVL